jgi:catechol 2,3-dioxygenase-like lactoylglutathione lyase family enzyme
MGLSAQRLDHWTLVTSDLARTRQFYTEVLDAEPIDRAFPAGVTFGGTTIDFFLAGDQQHPSPGTDHHAYIIALQDFDAWTEQLRGHGVSVSFGNFGKTRMSLLFDDPDGYHFEFVVPMDSEEVAKRELEKRGIQPRRGGSQVSWPTAPL